jgi:hypothetical protein
MVGVVYQKLKAASFGPGKLAMGHKYRRCTAWATIYASHVATAMMAAEETSMLDNEAISPGEVSK